jgi:hypothetical protein
MLTSLYSGICEGELRLRRSLRKFLSGLHGRDGSLNVLGAESIRRPFRSDCRCDYRGVGHAWGTPGPAMFREPSSARGG